MLMKIAFSVVLPLFTVGVGLVAAADLPNVVLMMGDDHGWEETGYNGHPHLRTPVLDEMAATGLKFEHFYAAHPSCSPTRGSFLTGRHPNRYGTFAPGWSMRPEEITVGKVMADAGYHTGHFGKWHVGPVKAESPTSPGAMGFHEWVAHDNFFELDPSFSVNGGPPQVFPGESSEVCIAQTIQFIERSRAQGKPFFATVWFGSPHEPYSGLPEDLALYDDLPGRYPGPLVRLTSNETGGSVQRPLGDVLRERYAEITAMDRAIGQLRSFLKKEGLQENTLVFYCGDNGTSKDGLLKSPHRGAKGDMYDGGTLVPGLIEWPSRIAQPRQTRVRASTSDLLPTLCALTGQAVPGRVMDGENLLPLLLGEAFERSKPLFFWTFDTKGIQQRAPQPWIDPELQKGTTPLVKLVDGVPTRNFQNFRHEKLTDADRSGVRSVIVGDHKLLVSQNKKGKAVGELYDLAVDPAESRDLAQELPERKKELEKILNDWQGSVLQSLLGADYDEGNQ
jgi:arylsulfatase A-like enzyme